jgi:hypothetical protein
MGSSGEKRDVEKQKVIGQKAKKAKISNPSGIHSFIKTYFRNFFG